MSCVYKEYCKKNNNTCECVNMHDNDAYGDVLERMGYKYCDSCGEIIGVRDKCYC